MKKTEIREKFYNLIKEKSWNDPGIIDPKYTFYDLGFDSIDFWDLVITVEDIFHINVDDDSSLNFETVEDFEKYILEQLD